MQRQKHKNNHLLVFRNTHLVSGPLNGVLDDRGERLESAEWDLLFWGVPLKREEAKLRPRAVSLKEELELTTTTNKQQTLIHTHMAIVGLCQIWHNDFSVTFRSHGARVKKRSLIGHTAAEI